MDKFEQTPEDQFQQKFSDFCELVVNLSHLFNIKRLGYYGTWEINGPDHELRLRWYKEDKDV